MDDLDGLNFSFLYPEEDEYPPEGTIIGGDGEPIPPGERDPYPYG